LINQKGNLPDFNGGQPPNPRDLPHYGPKHGGGCTQLTVQCTPMLPPPDKVVGFYHGILRYVFLIIL